MKKPSNEIRLRVFVVAGAGLEPRDLRVMSPTSYLTAPPRIKGICSILLIFVFVNRFPLCRAAYFVDFIVLFLSVFIWINPLL